MIKYVAAFVALCSSFAPVGPISTVEVDNLADWKYEMSTFDDIMDEVDAGDETRYFVLNDDLFQGIENSDWPIVSNDEITI